MLKKSRTFRNVFFVSLIFLSISCFLSAAESLFFLNLLEDFPQNFFQDHEGQEEKRIRVRGFWYPLSENEGILASQPNLQSCCIGKESFIYRQVIVKGEVGSLPAYRAITLEGILKMLHINDHGKSRVVVILEEAREIEKPSFLFLMIVGLLIISGITYWIFYKAK